MTSLLSLKINYLYIILKKNFIIIFKNWENLKNPCILMIKIIRKNYNGNLWKSKYNVIISNYW